MLPQHIVRGHLGGSKFEVLPPPSADGLRREPHHGEEVGLMCCFFEDEAHSQVSLQDGDGEKEKKSKSTLYESFSCNLNVFSVSQNRYFL